MRVGIMICSRYEEECERFVSSRDNLIVDFVSKLAQIMVIVKNISKKSGRILHLGEHFKCINHFVKIQHYQ